jgi:hypothetical protein
LRAALPCFIASDIVAPAVQTASADPIKARRLCLRVISSFLPRQSLLAIPEEHSSGAPLTGLSGLSESQPHHDGTDDEIFLIDQSFSLVSHYPRIPMPLYEKILGFMPCFPAVQSYLPRCRLNDGVSNAYFIPILEIFR